MKLKGLLFGMIAVLCCITCSAKSNYSTEASVLPAQARSVLISHFPKQEVNHIKIDRNLFGVEGYDVVLNNGTEIEFDGKGNIKEVDCGRYDSVPEAIIVKDVSDYVAKTYPNQTIKKYEVKGSGYEVELESGLDLKFNKQGAFQGIDR